MNPVKPGSDKYPTGQQLNVSLAFANNKQRWQKSAYDINKIIEQIPYTKSNVAKDEAPKASKSEKRTATLKANTSYIWNNSAFELPAGLIANEIITMTTNAVKYTYQTDAALVDNVMMQIDNILKREILGGSDFWSRRFFLNQYIEKSVAAGTTDSFESAIRIVEGTSAERSLQLLTIQQQLASPQYMDRLNGVNSRVFELMKGLTGDMKSQLRVTLTEGMARGVGIRDLKGMINNRLGVGMARAERIARTEINNAYTNAYMNESIELNETALADDDWEIKQCHRSALAPTTRKTHAARHGTVCTVAQQLEWWAVAGRIQCLCSTLDVLVNKKTGEVLQQGMVDRMKKQKGKWFPTK